MTDTSPATLPADEPIGGYHPGGYCNFCVTCGGQFIGAKRCLTCRGCAVAELADLAAGGDAQREEDAKWVEQELPELVDMTACEAILDRLARYAREGWRAMDSAPRGGAENEPFLGCVDGVVKPLAVTGDPNVFVSLLDTDQTGVGEPVYVIPPRRRGRHMVVTHWRPLPAPPKENDDGR